MERPMGVLIENKMTKELIIRHPFNIWKFYNGFSFTRLSPPYILNESWNSGLKQYNMNVIYFWKIRKKIPKRVHTREIPNPNPSYTDTHTHTICLYIQQWATSSLLDKESIDISVWIFCVFFFVTSLFTTAMCVYIHTYCTFIDQNIRQQSH